MEPRAPRPYADPYVAGVSLGGVLLAAFVIMGRGLGASGAFATTAAGFTALVDADAAAANPYFATYVSAPSGPWLDWLLLEIVGVVIGGYLSARFAGRLAMRVERGAQISSRGRVISAFAGGSVMGIGAVLARGCTSGQALTGGALLAVGSWIFLAAAFAAAYAIAPVMKWAWK
jgi:uncharacterized membrane protein YedE/YeeE